MNVGHSFRPAPEGWTEVLHEKDGQVVARLLQKGTEVHFEIDPAHKHRVIFRNVTREFLQPVFEQQGFLSTKVPLLDDESRKFVTRLGFEHMWSDVDYDYYMLTALPFEKKEK